MKDKLGDDKNKVQCFAMRGLKRKNMDDTNAKMLRTRYIIPLLLFLELE